MAMRRLGISAIFAVALLAAVSASARGAHRRAAPRCPPRHSHLLAADAQAQVYEAPEVGETGVLPESLGIYGCAYGRRKHYQLGSPPANGSATGGGPSGTRLITLAGRIVAYEDYALTGQTPNAAYDDVVLVRNLGNGLLVHEVPTGPALEPEHVGRGRAAAIVLKADGSVAWINGFGLNPSRYEVHALDRSGERVLASGPDVAPHSLALAGNTLYWTQGGKPFSASLN
jgi:hypothetical protein